VPCSRRVREQIKKACHELIVLNEAVAAIVKLYAMLHMISQTKQVDFEYQCLLDTTNELLDDLNKVKGQLKNLSQEEAVEVFQIMLGTNSEQETKGNKPVDMDHEGEGSDSKN